jgi:hypothetical protein
MGFPVTKRYFLRFRHTDTGLTPVFTYFNNASSFAPITSPTINEVNGVGLGNGSYYFDYLYSTKTDPDVVFEVDGGASIPTEEIRYISDTISPKDAYVDEPISQVVSDVWSDSAVYSAGQKGFYVPEIGTYGDASSIHSLFGQLVFDKESIRGDSAGMNDGNSVKDVFSRLGAPVGASISADIQGVITQIQGGGPNLNQIAGVGFVSASDSLVAIASASGGITPTQVANAVWDALLTSHTVAGSFGITLGQTILGYTQRAVGLLHENSVLDLTSFDSNNNLTSGRLRIYSTASDAVAAQAASPGPYLTNMIAQYAITATYTGSNLTTYLVDRTA